MNVPGAPSAPIVSAAVPQPRLVQAAHEFEAQLMKELLKPMTDGGGVEEDDSDSGAGGALAEFATSALGQALSKHGGLGIATNILRSLSLNDKDSQTSSKSGNGGSALSMAGAAGLK
jgi:Rod binding domain-containing protein